jgi:hypothetical protein
VDDANQLNKKLGEIDGHYAIWKGDTLDMLEVKYEDRPFEKEAFRNQDMVSKELKKLLYDTILLGKRSELLKTIQIIQLAILVMLKIITLVKY